MNPWHILDLAPTSNLRDIKRAYAKKLKLIDQEKNPQDFLELRQAFEHAQYAAEVLRSAAESDDVSSSELWDDQPHHSQDYRNDSPFVEYIPPTEVPQAIAYNVYDELEHDATSNDHDTQSQEIPDQIQPNLDVLSFNVYDKFKLVEDQHHQDLAPLTDEQNIPPKQQDIDPIETKENIVFEKLLDPYGVYLSYDVYDILATDDDHDDDQNQDINNNQHEPQSNDDASSTRQDTHHNQYSDPNHTHHSHDNQYQDSSDSDDIQDIDSQNLNQQQSNLPPPIPHMEISEHKSPFPSFDVIETNQPADHPFLEFNHNLDQQLEQETYEIIEYIQAYNFDNAIFLRFKKLLENLENATLTQQLDLRERLRDCFADLTLDDFNPQFGAFISLWYQHFPEEQDCLQQDYNDERLSEYASIYLKQDQIYQDLSPKLKIAFEDLLKDQKFRPLDILSLYSHITKTMDIESPIEFMQDISIKNREKNANFIYLDLVENNWTSIWWIVLNIAVGCFIQLLFNVSSIAHILIFIGMIIWHVLIQNSLTAFILSLEKSDHVLLRLNQTWLISGLILCATPYLLPTLLHQSFSFLWVMLTVTIFSCAQHLYPSAIKRLLFDAQKIKADGWVTSVIFVLSIFGLTSLFSNGFESSTIWMMSFCLIPIGFILFNSFFYQLYLSFGYRVTAPEEFADYSEHKRYRIKQFLANFAFIIFRAIWVITAIYFLVKDPQDQYFFYLSLFSFITILLLGFSEKIIQYIFKYISYLASIIASLLTIIPPLVLSFLLFKTLKLDRGAH